MGEDEYLTAEQAAEKLQLHARTVRRLLASGELPGRKVGGKDWRISADRKSTRLNSSHAEIYTLHLHDALPISSCRKAATTCAYRPPAFGERGTARPKGWR